MLTDASRTLISGALRGALEIESTPTGIRFQRLPAWARAQSGDDVWTLAASLQGAGVHLEFETAATFIELEVMVTRFATRSIEARPALFGSVENGVQRTYTVTSSTVEVQEPPRTVETIHGRPAIIRFEFSAESDPRVVAIYFPHNAVTELRGLRADAPLRPAPRSQPRWLHYGSSISHAAAAESPLSAWPVAVALATGLDLTNLGLGGAAHVDPFIARIIRDEPADLVTLKLGINPVNGDTLRMRTFRPAVEGFLDTIRDAHATTPIVVISPLFSEVHEDRPGPTLWDVDGKAYADTDASAADGRLTLSGIRRALMEIVEHRADPALSYLDGRTLLGEAEIHLMPDRLHPEEDGQRLIAGRFIASGIPSLAHSPDQRPAT